MQNEVRKSERFNNRANGIQSARQRKQNYRERDSETDIKTALRSDSATEFLRETEAHD